MFTSVSHQKAQTAWRARWLPRGVAALAGLAIPLALAAAAGAAALPQARGAAAVPHGIAGRAGTASLRVVSLGTLGGTFSEANGINGKGQVVGSSTTSAGAEHAFLWSGGTMRDLGTLGGPFSSASGINDSGQVVGASETRSGALHAFLWSGGTMRDLGTLGGPSSYASAINDHGQVAGTGCLRSALAPCPDHAFRWSNGQKQDLGTLGGLESEARAINEHGTVIGYTETHQADVSFIYYQGQMHNLGNWDATAINDQRVVAGYADTATSLAETPVLWQGGRMRHLPVQAGFNTCEPQGINNYLQVTMGCFDAHDGPGGQYPPPAGYVWYRGHYHLLPTLPGATATSPGAINDQGQIAGTVHTAAGDTAVLWTQ
jgi:probable HAF family extracellular repeat protein